MQRAQSIYNDELLRALVCVCCARTRLDTAHVHSEIEFKDFTWFLTLETEKPGIVEKCFSQARFDLYYRKAGTPLAKSGSGAVGDIRIPDFSD